MEKQSAREKKRDSAKRSTEYSCYSSKSILIKEENKKSDKSKDGSSAQAHMHHGEACRSSPRDSALCTVRGFAAKTRHKSYYLVYGAEYSE